LSGVDKSVFADILSKAARSHR